ncbi:MAG: hypothetical protein R2710_21840 [Acidimicrobiales bacterium]
MQRGRTETIVDGGQLRLDALLLLLHQVEWHGVGVVGLQQLGLLVEQLGLSALLDVALPLCRGLLEEHFVEDQVMKLGEHFGGGLNRLVVVLDLSLDGVDQDSTLRAFGALLLAPEADEIRVDLASPSPVVGHE